MSWDLVVPEIHNQILKSIDSPKDLATLMLLNRRWLLLTRFYVHQNPKLVGYKALELFTDGYFRAASRVKNSKDRPTIKSLQFCESGPYNDQVDFHFARLFNLKFVFRTIGPFSLTLSGSISVSDETVKGLFVHFQELEYLEIDSLQSVTCDSLMDIYKLRKLKTLILKNWSNSLTLDLYNPQLTTLFVSRRGTVEHDVLYITSQLESLTLDSVALSDSNLRYILCGSAPTLRKLDLKCRQAALRFKSHGLPLEKLESLESLSLAFMDLPNSVALTLPKLPALKHLHLMHVDGIVSDCIEAFSQCKLSTFHLKGTIYADSADLMPFIQNNTFVNLAIDGSSNFGDEILDCLMTSASRTTLQNLELRWFGFSKAKMDSFVASVGDLFLDTLNVEFELL